MLTIKPIENVLLLVLQPLPKLMDKIMFVCLTVQIHYGLTPSMQIEYVLVVVHILVLKRVMATILQGNVLRYVLILSMELSKQLFLSVFSLVFKDH